MHETSVYRSSHLSVWAAWCVFQSVVLCLPISRNLGRCHLTHAAGPAAQRTLRSGGGSAAGPRERTATVNRFAPADSTAGSARPLCRRRPALLTLRIVALIAVVAAQGCERIGPHLRRLQTLCRRALHRLPFARGLGGHRGGRCCGLTAGSLRICHRMGTLARGLRAALANRRYLCSGSERIAHAAARALPAGVARGARA